MANFGRKTRLYERILRLDRSSIADVKEHQKVRLEQFSQEVRLHSYRSYKMICSKKR